MYCVDTNFFIEAYKTSYPLDVATSFWEKIIQLAQSGKLISIDRVFAELSENKDDLYKWCMSNLGREVFVKTSPFIDEYSKVARWAVSKSDHYLPKAISEFLSAKEADAWLVSYAMNNKSICIVTQEKSEPARRNKIKIPDVCNVFGVKYCSTIEMFRQLGEKF